MRFLWSFIFLILLGALAGSAYAQEDLISQDVWEWAEYAQIDPVDLQGAVNTTGLSPEDYLVAVGEVIKKNPSGWPIEGPLGQRIYCIEGIESTHGLYMYNPQPWAGEHAQGWLGYLPSTARSVGVRIGDRTSEWRGAARMLTSGRGREFYGVAAGIC